MLNSIPERLRKHIRVTESGCWEWTGARVPGGYGRTRNGVRFILVHRLVFELMREPVAGRIVCHHCDNPPCCNPEHLFAGTHRDNALDCISKGRRSKHRAARARRLELAESMGLRSREALLYRERKGVVRGHTCKRCGQRGHNVRTCRG